LTAPSTLEILSFRAVVIGRAIIPIRAVLHLADGAVTGLEIRRHGEISLWWLGAVAGL
jgi:hypothetical protein